MRISDWSSDVCSSDLNNTSLVWEAGDEAGTKAAFAKAHHVTKLAFVNNRVVVNSMEPRGTLGSYDAASQTFTLYTGSQGSHRMLPPLCDSVFKVPREKMHIITPDVGGGFGRSEEHTSELQSLMRISYAVF